MDKSHILAEIRRTAEANGGQPLGIARFGQDTGIKLSDWFGLHWKSWGDALVEAGFQPNMLQGAYSDDVLLKALVHLIHELGRFPVNGELRLKRRRDPDFPSHNVFRRLGSRSEVIAKVASFCRSHPGLEDVARACALAAPGAKPPLDSAPPSEDPVGFVYLVKSGRYYKIGKTNSIGRRERELAIQLPEESRRVHVIRTDDPSGIEEYWHRRFGGRRKNGEWFELDAKDVTAFRRRKFM